MITGVVEGSTTFVERGDLMRRTLKPVVAVIAALALVGLTAPPSAAVTVGTTTAGTLTVNLTPALTLSMAGVTGTHCSPTKVTVNLDTAETGTATVNLALRFDYNGASWVMIGSGTGAFVIANSNLGVGSITMTGVNVYPMTVDNSSTSQCLYDGTSAKCGTITVSFPMGLSGPFSGTVAPPGVNPSSFSTLSGTANIAAVGCTPPFSALNGKTGTITSWVVAF